MTTLHAEPMDRSLDVPGFDFSSFEEFEEAAQERPDTDYMITLLEADSSEDEELLKECNIEGEHPRRAKTLKLWFDEVEPLDDEDKVKLFYLMDCLGYSVSDALDNYDDVMLYKGYEEDAAREIADEYELYQLPERLQIYFDYEKYARDLSMAGDICEFEFCGKTWTCTNANSL